MKARSGLLLTMALFIAAFSEGCVAPTCASYDQACIDLQTPVRFDGEAISDSWPYTAGQGIHVTSVNGEIKVRVGTQSDVEVTFQPFAVEANSSEAEARQAISTSVTAKVSEKDGVIDVTIALQGSSSLFGGDITVTLPASFAGSFAADQGNGDVDVDLSNALPSSTSVTIHSAGSISLNGARGALHAASGVGDVSVGIASWAASGQDGSIATDNGTITIAAPSSADGQLTLRATGEISASGVPSTWSKLAQSSSETYTMATGHGATVQAESGSGGIDLVVR